MTSTKLYRANVGKADFTNRTSWTPRSQLVLKKKKKKIHNIYDLCFLPFWSWSLRLTLESVGFTVPMRRASWWSSLTAACLESASQWASCPPAAWRRAGRWGWLARRAGPGGAGVIGRNVEAGWGTASSRTLSGRPGPSPAGTPHGQGPLDHMHLKSREKRSCHCLKFLLLCFGRIFLRVPLEACRQPTTTKLLLPNLPGEKSAMALRQLYSAVSTCSLFSLSTWSWKTLTWSMKDTTRSADMGDEWNPAAASRGAICIGKADWAAFRMNSSLQLSLSSATCRVDWTKVSDGTHPWIYTEEIVIWFKYGAYEKIHDSIIWFLFKLRDCLTGGHPPRHQQRSLMLDGPLSAEAMQKTPVTLDLED